MKRKSVPFENLSPRRLERLREALDSLRSRYDTKEALLTDPLQFPHRYETPRDREAAALLSSLFAYGNVRAMSGFLDRLLGALGRSPSESLRKGALPKEPPFYRFQSGTDVTALLKGLGALIREGEKRTPGRKNLFEFAFGEPGDPLDRRIDSMQRNLLKHVPGSLRSRGLIHLVGSGTSPGSARKRYCMFLRWVVRKEFPDLGLYGTFQPKELVIPLDVHMARMGRRLGFTERATGDWKTALEITRALRRISPGDPLQFDFSLTRPGITGLCPDRSGASLCAECVLEGFCSG